MSDMLASFISDSSANPDQLIAGETIRHDKKITLLSGENRTRGALLGEAGTGGGTAAAKAGGNTGTGTLTMDATTPVHPGAKQGVYQVRFIAAAANNGTFRVTDPEGFVLGDVVMAAGAGAFDNDVKFAVADAGTDFIVGDGFDITVAAGSGKYKLSAAAAVDGSEVPLAILAHDCDASAGDKEALVYTTGDFNERRVTFGAGHTADSVREALASRGIYLIPTVGA